MSIDAGWYKQLFDIRRSVRYHNRRRGFYDCLDMLTNVVGLIFGSAAVYGVLEKNAQSIALVAAGIVTSLSSVNLVVGSSQRARAHADFSRRFVELERWMVGVSPTFESLAEVKQKRLTIEAEEPPVLRVLDCICHNDEMRAQGYEKNELVKIRWWQHLTAQFFDLREDLIYPAASNAHQCKQVGE